MASYKFSRKLRFLPWTGSDYATGGPEGKRLLIIGESHYSGSTKAVKPDRDNRWLTNDVIERQWNGKSYSYFTKISQAVSGIPHPEIDKENFWSTVAFYNYVQDIVSVGARVRPTEEQWKHARELLPGVLDALAPQYVLATGQRLWWHLPESWMEAEHLRFEGQKWETCTASTANTTFRATYIQHPSYPRPGGSLSWHPLVRKFLALPACSD